MNLKRDKKTKNIAGNGEEKINNPLYTPFPSSKLNKLKKKNKTAKQVKEKSYKSPKKKTKMGFLKVTSELLVLVAVYQAVISLYLTNANKEQNFTNDFDTGSVIQDPNGNGFETDDNGQINPFPVTDKEKKTIINNIKNAIARDAKNFKINEQVESIDGVNLVKIDQIETSGTFSNYLYSIRFSTASSKYDMQFWADNVFLMSEEDKSDVDKLNEFYSFILSPDNCALFNISPMNEMSAQIMNILNKRGSDVAFVGEAILATASSNDIIYKIPVYNNDGTVVVWTSTIAQTKQIDNEGLTAEEALIKQLQEENVEYFSPVDQSQQAGHAQKEAQALQNVDEIYKIFISFQSDISNAKIINNKTNQQASALTLTTGDGKNYVEIYAHFLEE